MAAMWRLRTAQWYTYWINKEQDSLKKFLMSSGEELWYALLYEMCKKLKREVPKICLEKYKSCQSFSEALFEVVSAGKTGERWCLVQTWTVDERKLKNDLTFLRDE